MQNKVRLNQTDKKGMKYGHNFYQKKSVHFTICDFSATLDYYDLLFTRATAFGNTGDTELPK